MNFRSPALLQFAKCQPCQRCRSTGTTVAAHANSIAMGKGMGIKAHDYAVAYLCHPCHDLIDGRVGKLTKSERDQEWRDAHIRTVALWFTTGMVEVCKGQTPLWSVHNTCD